MSWSVYLVVFVVMAVGATVQSAAGFGQGLIAAPALRLLHEDLLPGPIVIAGLLVALSVFVRNSRRDDLPVVVPALGGRVIGNVVALVALALLSDRGLSITIGLIVLGFVVLRLLGVAMARAPATLATAGVVSGVGGTIAALGGAPMALLYEQHAEARNFRGPMGWYTLVGSTMSVAMLAAAGEVDSGDLWLALTLLPPIGVGIVAARWLTPVIDRGYLRPLVLGLAGTSATVLIAGQL